MEAELRSRQLKGKDLDLCFAGNMLGGQSGLSYGQGQIVSEFFARDGFNVTCVSSRFNKISRLADILWTIFRGRNRFDAVFFDTYSGLNMIAADAASRLCGLLGLPLIMVLHGGNLPEFSKKYPAWTKNVLQRADKLAAPSEYLAIAFNEKGFAVRVIPNVIDLEVYCFRHRDSLSPRLFWMRSFHPLYNPDMAVRVLHGLRRKAPDATLVMAGSDKGERESVLRLAASLEVEDAVEFLGFLDEENKLREFEKADIYINTNHIDNMPVSVVEARAMGLPVIATNVGGLPFLIRDGHDGMLVPDGDVDGMIDAILRLLGDAELAGKISKRGRVIAERSSWKSVRDQLEDLIDDAISGHLRQKTTGSPVGKYSV